MENYFLISQSLAALALTSLTVLVNLTARLAATVEQINSQSDSFILA